MRIERRYTVAGQDPYSSIPFRQATSEIRNPNGSVVFRQENVEVPAGWSQNAVDVLVQKYFRKAGVPQVTVPFEEESVPLWLRRRVPAPYTATLNEFGGETSAKQVFDRLAGCWTYWGWKGGYFMPSDRDPGAAGYAAARPLAEENARAFFDELRYMLAMQMAAPNSPQWFNTGLHWAYGIDGPAQGHHYVREWHGNDPKNAATRW
jgi:ribonucleoside-diphosphate reductase alpha chain